MIVDGFDWDDGNRDKCLRHGVSIPEIEAAFHDSGLQVAPDVAYSQVERRFKAIGRTGQGRHVFVVFTFRDVEPGRMIRPISARFMHAKEIAHYEAQGPGIRNG